MWQGLIDRVQNPLWWFDAVFPLIIGVFLTTLVWPALTRWIAKYSEWYRNRKAVALAKQEMFLEFLVSNPTLLTTHNFVTVIILLSFLMILAMLILMRLFIGFTDVAQSPYSRGNTTTVYRVAFMVLMLFSTWIGYKAASQVAVTIRAYSILFRRHMAKDRKPESSNVPPTQNRSS